MNTFVIFLSRVAGFVVDRAVFRSDNRNGVGPGFFIVSMVLQILLGILASMIVAWFSRQREFRADAGSADYLGSPRPMMNALARLGGAELPHMPEAVRAFGINDRPSGLALFSTQPPIDQRIAALKARGG